MDSPSKWKSTQSTGFLFRRRQVRTKYTPARGVRVGRCEDTCERIPAATRSWLRPPRFGRGVLMNRLSHDPFYGGTPGIGDENDGVQMPVFRGFAAMRGIGETRRSCAPNMTTPSRSIATHGRTAVDQSPLSRSSSPVVSPSSIFPSRRCSPSLARMRPRSVLPSWRALIDSLRSNRLD